MVQPQIQLFQMPEKLNIAFNDFKIEFTEIVNKDASKDERFSIEVEGNIIEVHLNLEVKCKPITLYMVKICIEPPIRRVVDAIKMVYTSPASDSTNNQEQNFMVSINNVSIKV